MFAVDASTGDRVQIFFERLPGGVAVTWARLKINNRIFTLYEQCSKDLSDGMITHKQRMNDSHDDSNDDFPIDSQLQREYTARAESVSSATPQCVSGE